MGGTMDPVHIGHLLVAEEARVALDLEEVLFIPTGQPWMKPEGVIASGTHRMNMVRLAIGSNPFFRASALEVDRVGPSYTVDTLEALKAGDHRDDDLHFILGVDLLKDLHRWRAPDRMLELCSLVVVPRVGYDDQESSGLDSVSPGASAKTVFLDGPAVGVSSTEIRWRAASGCSIRYMVPEAVEAYIERYGLYREEG
jgi:nicotinate-nucleotide adenylyltransferase